MLVNFQKIILELTTVVDGCKGQVWGLKPAQGPLSSGYRKFNPRTALTRNWIKNKTWGTVQRWSSYPFMRPEVARGGREAAKQLLGRKTAKKRPVFLAEDSLDTFNDQLKWKIQLKIRSKQFTNYNYSSNFKQFNQFISSVRSFRQFVIHCYCCHQNTVTKGCVTIRFHTLSLLWPLSS